MVDFNKKNVDKNETFTKKAGDKLERAGEKISEKGAGRLGSAISNAGDKLEHTQDRDTKFRK